MLVKWKLEGQDGLLLSRIPEQVFALAYHPTKGLYALGTRSGALYEIDAENLQLVRQWQAHSGSIFDLQYINNELISLGEDGTIKRWGPDSLVPLQSVQLSPKSLRCSFYSQSSLWLGGSEGKVWELNPDNFFIKSEFQASDNSVFAIQKKGNRIFTVGRDAHLHVWIDGKEQADIAAHWYTIHALSLSPDSKYLATGSMDKSIKIWDARSNELLKVVDFERFGGHKSSVNKIIWMDPTHFLSCSDDRLIYLFSIKEV